MNINKILNDIFPWNRVKRLRKALDEVTEFPMYPKAVHGHRDYRRDYNNRTPYMEGWNACAMDAINRLQGILKDYDW